MKLALVVLGLALGAALSACSNADIGKVCTKKEDCSGDLICDVHDGQGTCQEPHHHDESEGESATTDAATDAATAG